MKKSAMTIAVAALVVSATAAFAKVDTGTVASVDKAADSITLNSGQVFHLPENIEVETIKAGEKIRVSYFTTKGGKAEVKSIQPLK